MTADGAAFGGDRGRHRTPALSTLVGGAVVLAGLVIGLRPISDNSFFTHLATGRLILERGIPRVDPYSFTAAGHAWVVQSWLPAAIYGAIERISPSGLVLLHGAQTAALAALGWRLTCPARTLLSRMLAVAPMIVVGNVLWSPRPLLFGLLLLALVMVLAEEERFSPLWLLPIGWLWVNSHGSFPFAPLYLALRLGGRWIDGEDTGRLQRLLGFSVAGVLAGALNPLGPRLLAFPVHLLSQRAVLSQVIEWMSPDFSVPGNLVFLVEAVAALALLARRRSWEDGLVAAVFAVVGMLALRNTVVVSLVLVPILARGVGDLGELRGERRSPVIAAALAVLVLFGSLLGAASLRRPSYRMADYPVRELRWIGRQGWLDDRVATSDIVGNLRTFQEGPGRRVFIDDRFDMYPRRIALDYIDLYYGRPDSMRILDRYRIDTVLWDRRQPLAGLVVLDERWDVVLRTHRWLVARRVTAP